MSKTIVLTFDDGCVNHTDYVVPLLKRYGFGATFFACSRDKWCQGNEEYFLDGKGFAAIHQAGFEIGNHTLNHVGMQNKSDDLCRKEIGELNKFLASYGIPAPVSFAYPGGPYAPNAAKLLPEFNLRCARTTEHGIWNLETTDWMRVPCYAVSENSANFFDLALEAAEKADDESSAAVILYHGIPDIIHPWCSTPPEIFEKQMKHLADNAFQVISMAEFMARKTTLPR